MELYLKQNTFSFDTKLCFYDKQDNLCFSTTGGINHAAQHIKIFDQHAEQLVTVVREQNFLQQSTFHILLRNGGELSLKSQGFLKKRYTFSDTVITITKTKRKTLLLKFAEYPVMEYSTKKEKDLSFTKITILEEKYLPIALAVITALSMVAIENSRMFHFEKTAIF